EISLSADRRVRQGLCRVDSAVSVGLRGQRAPVRCRPRSSHVPLQGPALVDNAVRTYYGAAP
ncbi:MAG: hypothetical protein QOJ37_1378, partial [Pseudonocardiales bacterium]|nr:hypothetical protein [Pseudonocardiales bacterium]